MKISDVMTPNPKRINGDHLASEAMASCGRTASTSYRSSTNTTGPSG